MKDIFVSAMGQYDNVGDTVLRRPFLRALREAGPLNVFVGTRSDDYLSALGLDGSERLFRDPSKWRRTLASTMARSGALFAFNAGEIELTDPYAAHYLRLAPLLLLNKLRGGRSIHLGLGVRRPSRWVPAVRSVLLQCDSVSWRDSVSHELMRVGRVAPDWAFAEGADNSTLTARAADETRDLMVIAPRYNGVPLTEAWSRQLTDVADDMGLQLVVAAQIHRDNPVVVELARRWNAQAVLWDDGHHSRQEWKLREFYARARIVISERLHALVIGATEGAVPVAIGNEPSDKAFRTVASAGLPALGISPGAFQAEDAQTLRTAAGLSRQVATRVASARHELQDLKDQINALARD